MDMMTTRRDFLRLSAMAAGCVVSFPRNAFAGQDPGKLNYGVQLYMVRRQAATDLAGILKSIQQIGFTQIELYPVVYNHPAAELRRLSMTQGWDWCRRTSTMPGFRERLTMPSNWG